MLGASYCFKVSRDMRKMKLALQSEGCLEHKDAMNGIQLGVKRLFDIVFAFFGLILLSPLFLVFSLILVFQKGPVFFKQERIGYHGRPFYIYKFRSMRCDAEKNGIPRSEQDRNKYITPFGSFLSAHHLDELPQLWNVLIGDMSFVGPRPERRFFISQIERLTDDYQYIYLMKPGVTSYATISNGYTDTMEKMLRRLELDLDYLDHRTLLLDLRIIVKTVLYILSGRKF